MHYLINIEDMYKAVPGSRSEQPIPTIMMIVFKTKYFRIMCFYPTQLLEACAIREIKFENTSNVVKYDAHTHTHTQIYIYTHTYSVGSLTKS
jgi:hypothetical protein